MYQFAGVSDLWLQFGKLLYCIESEMTDIILLNVLKKFSFLESGEKPQFLEEIWCKIRTSDAILSALSIVPPPSIIYEGNQHTSDGLHNM